MSEYLTKTILEYYSYQYPYLRTGGGGGHLHPVPDRVDEPGLGGGGGERDGGGPGRGVDPGRGIALADHPEPRGLLEAGAEAGRVGQRGRLLRGGGTAAVGQAVEELLLRPGGDAEGPGSLMMYFSFLVARGR